MTIEYTIKVPSNDSQETEEFSSTSPIVILGKNGSGKSRFGAQIEINDKDNVHRISAQRSLVIPAQIPVKNLDIAEIELKFGYYSQAWDYASYLQEKLNNRWERSKCTTSLLNDIDQVFTVLFAKENLRNTQFVEDYRMSSSLEKNQIPESPIDKIQKIWNYIFPQRGIILKDAHIKGVLKGVEYEGFEMSDGERVALYLMAECFCVAENTILIIDEPEIHLHKSIINRLWDCIQAERPDCLFVFITHDLDFAAKRYSSANIIINQYDGSKWKYDILSSISDIPPEVITEIVGGREQIIFVEGDAHSYDFKLYCSLYPEFTIIPVGSCTKVIEYTKSINDNKNLHHISAFGIIDRDYRPETQLTKIKEKNIFSLNVAEVESLFITEEVIRYIASHQQKRDHDTIVTNICNNVLTRLTSELEKQITCMSAFEVNFALNGFELNHRNRKTLNAVYEELVSSLNIDDIYSRNETRLNKIIADKDYKEILKYYNRKTLTKEIAKEIGLTSKGYMDLVVNLLSEGQQDFLDSFAPYIPTIEIAVAEENIDGIN